MELLGTVSVKKQTLTFHAAGNQWVLIQIGMP